MKKIKAGCCPVCKKKEDESASQVFLAAIKAIQKDNDNERAKLLARIAELEKRLLERPL